MKIKRTQFAQDVAPSGLVDFALAGSPTVYFVIEFKHEPRFRYISPNVEQITGIGAVEFLDQEDFASRHVHPQDRDNYKQTLTTALAEGDAACEFRLLGNDGQDIWLQCRVQAAPDDIEPGATCLLGCWSETGPPQAEATEAMAAALDVIPNGFAVVGDDDRVQLCNAAYAQMYDLTPRQMVGKSVFDIHSMAMDRLALFDGAPLSEDEPSLRSTMSRLRQADAAPVEFKLRNGEWKQLSRHPLPGGGAVYIRSDITPIKQAEARLRDSEQHFRRIVELTPLPVWVVETESGEIMYASPAAAELVGMEWPISGSRYAGDYYADRADRARFVTALTDHGRLDGYEVALRRGDGQPVWVSSTARTFVHNNRRVTVTLMIDLTEQRRREQELRHARETLEDAIESLSEGFALYDAEDRLVMCNARYREFNYLSADMLTPGTPWDDFVRAGAERGQYVDAVGRVEPWIDERRASREALGTDLEFQQGDGRWYAYTNQRTRQGGTVVTRMDITQRKEMERALRDSETLIRRVLEAVPAAIGMTRADDGRVIYESPQAKALFGRGKGGSKAEWTRSSYVDPADRDAYLGELRRAGALNDYEIEFQRANGERFFGAVSARLIDYQGEPVIVSATVDLTERREVDAEMTRQREALHQSEKLTALGSLLAGVSHELNNPLSVVVGQALLLQETAQDPAIAKRAQKIGNAADRCARIVKTFLAMARQHPPERAAVSLNQMVEAMLEVTGYALRGADVSVELALDEGLPPVWADADQVTQVLTNLIVNAQQALQDKGQPRRLRIRSWHDRHDNRVRLAVYDNGPGIPEENRGRIFEPFYTTKDVGVGTGIGLSVCRSIMESHGGAIRVASKPGAWTEFTIDLPIAIAHFGMIAMPDDTPRATGAKVLVLDDEPDVTQMLRDVLEAQGHSVVTANTARHALRLVEGGKFDVILSDLRMPGFDGASFYEALAGIDPVLQRRTAFITGDTLGPSAGQVLTEADRPYLEKPFTPLDVRQLVETVLRQVERA
ncbi:MAG: PAS-domain containing protein [Alphaproteobacteria bacterium]